MLLSPSTILAKLALLPAEQLACLAELVGFQDETSPPFTAIPNDEVIRLLGALEAADDPAMRTFMRRQLELRTKADAARDLRAGASLPATWPAVVLRAGSSILPLSDHALLAIKILKAKDRNAPITAAEIGRTISLSGGAKSSNLSDTLTKMSIREDPLLLEFPKQAGNPKTYQLTDSGLFRLGELEAMYRQISLPPAPTGTPENLNS